MDFTLRRATASDQEFIWTLRVATMKDLISQVSGWDDALQRSYAAESLNGEIVLVDHEPVGVVTLSDWGDQWHLTWMAVIPSMQGQGLGTALISHCQQRAGDTGKPITLQVLRHNRAVRLYERSGFKVCDEVGHKLLMRWS